MARVLPCAGGGGDDEELERYVSEELLGPPLELVVDLPLAGGSESEVMAEVPAEPRRKQKRLVLKANKEQSRTKKRAMGSILEKDEQHQLRMDGLEKELELVQTEATKNISKLKEDMEKMEADRVQESMEMAKNLTKLREDSERREADWAQESMEMAKNLKRKDEQIEKLSKSLKASEQHYDELRAQIEQVKASVKPAAEDESLTSKIAEMLAAATKQSEVETRKGAESLKAELVKRIEASERSTRKKTSDELTDLKIQTDLETAAYRLELCELKSSLSKFLDVMDRLVEPR